ncbi:MAG: translation initiation factor IF-2 [Lachnospiraceae bacterium]|nr:translation initiation factor IF-2 [Lachnospiraceae bacterium]
MRVSELAKELGKSSKEVLDVLQKQGYGEKTHSSNVSDEQTQAIKKALAAPAKPEHAQGSAEAPKKKIAAVYRPQNAQTMKNPRPQAAPAQAAPAAENNRENARPQSQQSQNQGSYQGSRDNRQGGFQGNRDNRQGGYQGNRDNRGGQGGYQGNRDNRNGQGGYQGNRDNRGGQGGYQGNRDNRGGQGGYQGNRDNRNGQGGFQGNRDNRNGQGGYQGNRDNRNGQGGYQGNRDNRNSQGGYQGNRDNRNGQGGFQGNRDNRNGQGGFQGNRDNRGGQGGRSSQRDSAKSFDTPLATKPQSNRANKNAYKNDRYDKKNMTEDGPKNKGKSVSKHPFIMPQKPVEEKVEETIKVITIPDVLTIKELAEKMKLQPSAIVKKLFLKGQIVTLNQEIDYEQAEEIAMEYDVLCEKEEKVDVIEELLREDEEDEKDMVSRPPVVCVMGHVVHGKTSLLDAIRNANVTAKEAGGITQHIGAYVVEINGQKITFLDTPGHEAFTAMRMRGAQSTDIAVLVVAADDGVMPQTVEAINHAKAAGVEIIVAINKIDKPSANIERVKQELAEYELVPEDWGGSTIFVPVSAHTHEGIPELLEMIILTSEVKELKANPNRNARGLVIEAELDKGKGPVATVLVQKGTLRVGDNIAVGACYGKVRAMMDDKGCRVKEATPSTPVEILGLNGVPNAGEVFVVTENEKEARSFAETFISESKNKLLEETKAKLSLDDLFTQIKAGNVKELPIIVKADVQGSVEAVKQSLTKLSNEEVMVKVIHGGVGAINESDVSLASASNAIIIGFNVRPDATAKSIAEREKVDIRLYRVIYQAIEDVEAAMKGMLDPVFEEKVIGHAIVRQLFKASGVGTIAGSYVMDGKFQRGCSVRITREGEQIFEGALASLKRFKDDVKEVATGYECGLVFEKFNDVQVDDMVEAYMMVEVPR